MSDLERDVNGAISSIKAVLDPITFKERSDTFTFEHLVLALGVLEACQRYIRMKETKE